RNLQRAVSPRGEPGPARRRLPVPALPPAHGGAPVSPSSGPAALEAELDRLIQEHTADAATVVAARREYEERRGRVFEDEELGEAWSAAFIEWFLIERVEAGADTPVAARSLHAARAAGDVDRASLIRA